MEFVIGNKAIITPMGIILKRIKSQLHNGKLGVIKEQRGQNIAVCCPMHKDGLEKHPSCQVFADRHDRYTRFGQVYCFSCSYTASLDTFVNDCFGRSGSFGKSWLLDNCETAFISEITVLPKIDLTKRVKYSPSMSEELLANYKGYHDYMWKRKLSKDVVDRFQVGYDKSLDTLVFPVRDSKGVLQFITRRSVNSHFFKIPEGINKPVYLLYYIIKNNIDTCIITEGQIDALTSWSYGIPAVATMGRISNYQINELNKSGVRTFITMFDNDSGGQQFEKYFNSKIRKDVFVVNVHIPKPYKDINDLDIDTFWDIIESYNINSFSRFYQV